VSKSIAPMFDLEPSEIERLAARGVFTQIARLYSTWAGMIGRCHNNKGSPRTNSFYRDRGVTVCDRWRSSFEAFVLDVGPKPTPEHTLDRYPVSNGNYEPGNVRWATRTEQNRNLTRNVWLEHDGRRMLAIDWAAELGITRVAFHLRLKARLPPERLFAPGLLTPVKSAPAPKRPPKQRHEWEPHRCGVCRAVGHNRLTCAKRSAA
jgi:hypothetical protein